MGDEWRNLFFGLLLVCSFVFGKLALPVQAKFYTDSGGNIIPVEDLVLDAGLNIPIGASANYVFFANSSDGQGAWISQSSLTGVNASGDDDWTINGTDIYPNTAYSVGIGTNSPAAKLHVVGDFESNGNLDVVSTGANTGGDNNSIIIDGNSAGTVTKFIGPGPTGKDSISFDNSSGAAINSSGFLKFAIDANNSDSRNNREFLWSVNSNGYASGGTLLMRLTDYGYLSLGYPAIKPAVPLHIECPSGTVDMKIDDLTLTDAGVNGSQVGCMEPSTRSATNWYTAVLNCYDSGGGRLPNVSELIDAHNITSGLSVTSQEWTNDIALVSGTTPYPTTVAPTITISSANISRVAATSNVAYRCIYPRL